MSEPQTCAARVVLLGASNAVLGFRCAVRAARERIGAPLEVFAAIGHGRSYGVDSSVYTRILPAITTCNLWTAFRERSDLPTFAIVTDIGNDIAYGHEPVQVQGWLERALDRLAAVNAQVVITGLPVEGLSRLPRWKFLLFSKLFFPFRNIDQQRIFAAAQDLDQRIDRLARERKLVRIVPRREWYEHDPIHMALTARREAWRTLSASWNTRALQVACPAFDSPWRQTGRLIPERRTLFGRDAGRPQPCASLSDRTQFFLY